MVQFIDIRIRTSSGKPVNQLGRSILNGVTRGGQKGTGNVSRMITRQLKIEAPIWKKHLRNSIKTRSASPNIHQIFMNRYGPFIETGHPINTITPSSQSAFWRWIVDKAHGSPYAFRRALLKKGRIDMNPWISRGLFKVSERIGPEVVQAIRMELRKEGFK